MRAALEKIGGAYRVIVWREYAHLLCAHLIPSLPPFLPPSPSSSVFLASVPLCSFPSYPNTLAHLVAGHEVFAVLTHIDAYAPYDDGDNSDSEEEEGEGIGESEGEEAEVAAATEENFLEKSATESTAGSGVTTSEEGSYFAGGKDSYSNGRDNSLTRTESSSTIGKEVSPSSGGEFDRETDLPGIVSLW